MFSKNEPQDHLEANANIAQLCSVVQSKQFLPCMIIMHDLLSSDTENLNEAAERTQSKHRADHENECELDNQTTTEREDGSASG